MSAVDGLEVADRVDELPGGESGPLLQEASDEEGEEADREVGFDVEGGGDVDGSGFQVGFRDPECVFDLDELVVAGNFPLSSYFCKRDETNRLQKGKHHPLQKVSA